MARPEKKTPTTHLKAVETPAPPDTTPPSAVPTAQPAGARALDPEVPSSPRRRQFTAEFKRQVLAEADAAGPGEVGAILRKHGLYSSHLTSWRRQRDEAGLAGLRPRKRGRKPEPVNPLAGEVTRLERALKKAEARARRAEGMVAVQKKLAELFGEEFPPEEEMLEAERLGLPMPPMRKKR